MKRRILALFPPEFHNNPAHFRGLGLAFVYLALAILQLFTFESFISVTEGYGFPGGHPIAVIVALLLPAVAIVALPYLLSMKLSDYMYNVSRTSVLVTAGIWVVIAVWTNVSGNNSGNLGLFGATLETPNQWWSVIFIGFLAWAAWLMYSAHMRRNNKRVHPAL
jgi:hypothetical protein